MNKKINTHHKYRLKKRKAGETSQLTLCTASLLPEFQPAPCFLSAIIGHIDYFRCA